MTMETLLLETILQEKLREGCKEFIGTKLKIEDLMRVIGETVSSEINLEKVADNIKVDVKLLDNDVLDIKIAGLKLK